jgi:hypothetical protein
MLNAVMVLNADEESCLSAVFDFKKESVSVLHKTAMRIRTNRIVHMVMFCPPQYDASKPQLFYLQVVMERYQLSLSSPQPQGSYPHNEDSAYFSQIDLLSFTPS